MRYFGLACLLLLTTGILRAQRSVSPAQRYERLLCVVPMIGTGTTADPIRPKFMPAPGESSPFLSVTFVASDDKKFALVELVAADPAAFAALRADRTLDGVRFEKGKARKDDIEREFRRFRANFDLTKFGAWVR